MTVFRRHRRSIASQVLALLTVVWLNLALAPCVMAMGTQLGEQVNGHMGAFMMDDAVMDQSMTDHEPPCSHCPPEQFSCNQDFSSQCVFQAQVPGDSRLAGPLFDYPQIEFAPAPTLAVFPSGPSGRAVQLPPDDAPPPTGVALHVRFCVYLK